MGSKGRVLLGLAWIAAVGCGGDRRSAAAVVDGEEGAAVVETPAEPLHPPLADERRQAPEVSLDARCGPEVGRALEVARAALVERGVSEEALSGCTAAVTRCDLEAREEMDRETIATACRVFVRTGNQRVEVRFEPGPVTGAPDHAEAWLSEDLREVGRTWIGGSTYGVGRGGALVLRGVTGHRRHTHGGEAAQIGHATFVVRNATGAPVTLRAERVRWKTGHGDCLPPTRTTAELPVAQLTAADEPSGTAGDEAASVTVPVGVSELEVGFASQSAYYSWCDRFVASVDFREGRGATLSADAETTVVRVEPLRHER